MQQGGSDKQIMFSLEKSAFLRDRSALLMPNSVGYEIVILGCVIDIYSGCMVDLLIGRSWRSWRMAFVCYSFATVIWI